MTEQKMAILAARARKKEIARKVAAQRLQSSGYIPSQLAGLTGVKRLVEKGHYRLEGKAAEIYRAKEAIERAKEEIRKARPQKIVNVSRDLIESRKNKA
jgi:hypothetical protein